MGNFSNRGISTPYNVQTLEGQELQRMSKYIPPSQSAIEKIKYQLFDTPQPLSATSLAKRRRQLPKDEFERFIAEQRIKGVYYPYGASRGSMG